jgi:rhodanese-related sulfurtransferase
MLLANRKIDNSKKSISRHIVQVAILAVIMINMLSACTPQTTVETATNITTGTITQTEQTQTTATNITTGTITQIEQTQTTATEIPITSTNTVTTVTSSALTTTTKSTVITTFPLDWLDYPEVPRITAEELKNLYNGNTKPVIVDTRDITSFNEEHIPGALNIPYDDTPVSAAIDPYDAAGLTEDYFDTGLRMDTKLRWLPKDQLIVLYCE